MSRYMHQNTKENRKSPHVSGLILFTSADDAVMVTSLYRKTLLTVHVWHITLPAHVMVTNEEFTVQWATQGTSICTYWLITGKGEHNSPIKVWNVLKGKSKCLAASTGQLDVRQCDTRALCLNDIVMSGHHTRPEIGKQYVPVLDTTYF